MILDLCPAVKKLEHEFTASVCQERTAASFYIIGLYYQVLREVCHWHLWSYSRITMPIDFENLRCQEKAKYSFWSLLQEASPKSSLLILACLKHLSHKNFYKLLFTSEPFNFFILCARLAFVFYSSKTIKGTECDSILLTVEMIHSSTRMKNIFQMLFNY